MNLEEANARLKTKISEEQLWGLNSLYILLDLHKDDFCKIVETVGLETLLKKHNSKPPGCCWAVYYLYGDILGTDCVPNGVFSVSSAHGIKRKAPQNTGPVRYIPSYYIPVLIYKE